MPLKPSKVQDLLLNDFRLRSERAAQYDAGSEKSQGWLIREVIQKLYRLTIEPDINGTKDYLESFRSNREDDQGEDQAFYRQIRTLGLQCAVMSRDKSMIKYFT